MAIDLSIYSGKVWRFCQTNSCIVMQKHRRLKHRCFCSNLNEVTMKNENCQKLYIKYLTVLILSLKTRIINE